jgi:hypothetical protein
MRSVRADHALERKKEKEKKEREKRKRLKERAEKEKARKKKRRATLRKRREKMKKKLLRDQQKQEKSKTPHADSLIKGKKIISQDGRKRPVRDTRSLGLENSEDGVVGKRNGVPSKGPDVSDDEG